MSSSTSDFPNQPILGPENRESFFDAQARDRRASWKLAAACSFGVLLMGIALVLALAPPLVAVVILAADILSVFTPASPDVFDMFMGSTPAPSTPLGAWLLPALIVVPGTILALVSWRIAWRLTSRFELSTLFVSEVTREPRTGDLEEQQLGNVVAEMAIAAGVQPPTLRMLDGAGMNAVALGTGDDHTTIVVTRGLLERLDRQETQAIIGHLVASIGNGDLRIAHYILAMYATVGFLERLPFAPFDPGMRARLRAIARRSKTVDAEPVEDPGALARELYRSPTEEADADPARGTQDLLAHFQMRATQRMTWADRLPKPIAQGLAAPLFYVTIAQGMCRLALLTLLVNPLLALLWRRRRVLADASAVQLCREPSSLARALSKMSQHDAPRLGNPFLAFLFPASRARGGWGGEGNFGGTSATFPAPSLPDLGRRTARLQRMGAQRAGTTRPTTGPMCFLTLAGRGILALLQVALWAFCFGTGCLVLAASIFVGAPLAFFLLLLGPHILLRGIIPWILGR